MGVPGGARALAFGRTKESRRPSGRAGIGELRAGIGELGAGWPCAGWDGCSVPRRKKPGEAFGELARTPPGEELRAVPGEIVDGHVTLHERAWTPDDLWGAAFCIGALEDEAECVAFVVAARGAGAIVNAVDRPHLCDVKFGAIVNRSPLVVGISTEGAAPVFGQTVRARIECMLPRGFKAWIGAARDWRVRLDAQHTPHEVGEM